MKKRLVLALFALTLAFAPATAQDEARPEFANAPVTDVLAWAQRNLGVGFLYEGKDLLEPGSDAPRRVTASGALPATRAEKLVLMLELLRRAGLVAFEVGGLPGPTYQLYGAADAARAAPILDHPDQLQAAYFAGLTIRLGRAEPVGTAARIREKLSPVGRVEAFEATGTLLVTDFADRLRAAWAIAHAADVPTDRDDDLTVLDINVTGMPAARHLAALERVRAAGETWRASMNASANVLLVSGRRDELARVAERSAKLLASPEQPLYTETTQTIKLIFLLPAEGVKVLREMFATGIELGSVQLGVLERDRRIVFRGSDYDFQRARETISRLDVQPAQPAGE